MPELVSKSMEIHWFQESFAFQLRVDSEWIWGRFGIDLGRFGVSGGSSVALEPPWAPKIEFWSISNWFWDPSWDHIGPNLEALRRLGASCGCLWAVVSPFISVLISDPFSDFILHRFWTPKLRQNHLKIKQKVLPKPRKKKTYFDASSIEISRESDAEAKRADLWKLYKNCIFVLFWISAYVSKS